MFRRLVLLFFLALTPANLLAASPNFVFLLADDLGHGDLGCFGHPAIRTPHLDRLAAEGLRLTSFYSPAPVCSPSRAGFLTGRNPYRDGIRDWIPLGSGIHLPKGAPSIAALVKAAGYRTAHVGKWHLNSRMNGSEPTPGDHGFEHWFSTQNNAAPSHQNPTNFIRNGKPAGALEGNSSTLIVDEALRWLKGVKDEPFLLFVWFHAPHEPVAVPEEWARKYPDVEPASKRTYFASVSLLDHEVGRLLEALDERKARDNTFVFFTSDNGPETLDRYKGAQRSHGSPGPLRGMKLHLYEAGSRVPGIVNWPGKIKGGQVSDEPVWGCDLLPSLCELAGVKPPGDATIDGASFTPVFQGKSINRETPPFWVYDKALNKPFRLALRQGAWKLLADQQMNTVELYHLATDIGERKNLANKERERVAELKGTLKKLRDGLPEAK